MPFEIYLQSFHDGEAAPLPRQILRDAFGAHLVKPKPRQWQLRYEDENDDALSGEPGPNACTCEVDISSRGKDPEHWDSISICIERPAADPRLWEALAVILRQGNIVLYSPNEGAPLAVSSGVAAHLSAETREILGEPKVISSAAEIRAAMEAAAAEVEEFEAKSRARAKQLTGPPTRQEKRAMFLFLGVMLILAVISWHGYFSFRADSPADFGSVSGSLDSAVETAPGLLDIHLAGSGQLYRVPKDGYRSNFRRKAFFAEVHQGDPIELSARKEDLAEPSRPMLSSDSIVFVRGVRSRGRDYGSVQDHIAWQYRNRNWGLVIALIASAFLVICGTKLWRRWGDLEQCSG